MSAFTVRLGSRVSAPEQHARGCQNARESAGEHTAATRSEGKTLTCLRNEEGKGSINANRLLNADLAGLPDQMVIVRLTLMSWQRHRGLHADIHIKALCR